MNEKDVAEEYERMLECFEGEQDCHRITVADCRSINKRLEGCLKKLTELEKKIKNNFGPRGDI